MAFHFELETLLRYRRTLKEQERRVLRAINSNLAALRHRLEELRAERDAERHALNERLSRGLGAAQLRQHQATEELLDQSEQAVKLQIEKFERARLMQTQRYQQSWRNCETIEKLRERQFGEWRTEQARLEQNRLDEMTVARFRRNQLT